MQCSEALGKVIWQVIIIKTISGMYDNQDGTGNPVPETHNYLDNLNGYCAVVGFL